MRDSDPVQNAERVMGIADLESFKRQVRAALGRFQSFERAHCAELKGFPIQMKVVCFLQHLLQSSQRISRVSTIGSYARLLQSALVGEKILGHWIVKKYLKGLGRIQVYRPSREVASMEQYFKMLDFAPDPWTRMLIMILARGAARYSDLRIFLGGGGSIHIDQKKREICLKLTRRKTDQSGNAPAAHLIGPVVASTLVEQEVLKDCPLWGQPPNPLVHSPYKSPAGILSQIQKAKKKAGIISLLALRRMRAQTAARVGTMAQVGEFLGHRPGSRVTSGYVGGPDCATLQFRRKLAKIC